MLTLFFARCYHTPLLAITSSTMSAAIPSIHDVDLGGKPLCWDWNLKKVSCTTFIAQIVQFALIILSTSRSFDMWRNGKSISYEAQGTRTETKRLKELPHSLISACSCNVALRQSISDQLTREGQKEVHMHMKPNLDQTLAPSSTKVSLYLFYTVQATQSATFSRR